MSEIIRPLISLEEGDTYEAKDGEAFVIMNQHSLMDIARFMITQSDREEAIRCVKGCSQPREEKADE